MEGGGGGGWERPKMRDVIFEHSKINNKYKIRQISAGKLFRFTTMIQIQLFEIQYKGKQFFDTLFNLLFISLHTDKEILKDNSFHIYVILQNNQFHFQGQTEVINFIEIFNLYLTKGS